MLNQYTFTIILLFHITTGIHQLILRLELQREHLKRHPKVNNDYVFIRRACNLKHHDNTILGA